MMAIDLDRAPEILRRIADTLGIPVDSLFADPGAVTDAKGQAAECLRLWSRLRTDEQRRRALAALQALVDEPDLQR